MKTIKKYYPYSVKEELGRFFPGDTLAGLCGWNGQYACHDPQKKIPYGWAYADWVARDYFRQDLFLKETILCDDYIAYLVQNRTTAYAILAFLHFREQPFELEPRYAYGLGEAWRARGYEPVIMRNSVAVEEQKDGTLRFRHHIGCEIGTDFWLPTKVGDRYLFVRMEESFWIHAQSLLMDAVCSGLRAEYESLLTEDAVLSRCAEHAWRDVVNGRYDTRDTVATGIDAIKAYFDGRLLPTFAYVKQQGQSCHEVAMVSEGCYYLLSVGISNQLKELMEEPVSRPEDVIPIPHEQMPHSFLMPSVTAIRALDIKAVHGYVIQTVYSDGCVKNYCLYSFQDMEIPDAVTVDGFRFDADTLGSVRYVREHCRDGALFSNGYFIPEHILYYRGSAQLIPEKISQVVFENDTISITGLYRLPLRIRRGALHMGYAPRADAYYGAEEAMLNGDGSRKSDYSGYWIASESEVGIYATRSAVSDKVGYLKRDGSWLIPPVFDEGEAFERDYCVKVKLGQQQFLLNTLGELLPFAHEIWTDELSKELCPFSAGKFEGSVTYPEEEYFDELSAGKWGYINRLGRVVIEPQYVFATGFWYGEGRAFVAKKVGTDVLWGLIDETGKEIIPCEYINLATHHGTAVNFQRERYGKYGIMDFNGKVIMEPRYRYIREYSARHGLIAAGNDWNAYGVASVSDGRVIVPFVYECVDFEEDYIECETQYGETCYFDYDGNPLPPGFPVGGWHQDEMHCLHRDGKIVALDATGTPLPHTFEESHHVDYFQQGFLVMGTKGKRGLSTVAGKVILPERYGDIRLKEGFIIASRGDDRWRSERDAVFLLDGTPVFEDLCRCVHIDGSLLTRETPAGEEFYHIQRKAEG